MKKASMILVAFALLTFGMVSCEPEVDGPDSPTNPTSGQWVDLGLPSGLLWAKCNLGATNPEDYGDYYAWGETSAKETYNWITYRYATIDADGNLQTLTKYNTSESYGMVDNKTTLEASDDVATAVLGNGARIPTKAEWQELLYNTTAEWTTQNGVYGRKFTAANGNSLFLPAAGGRDGSSLLGDGPYGGYWSSSLGGSYPGGAWDMGFNSDGQGVDVSYRNYGRSVRAVRSQD